MFFARVIGHTVDRVVFKNERGLGLGYWIGTIVAEILLSILASMIVMWFSRYREYRADAAGADLAGKSEYDRRIAQNSERNEHPFRSTGRIDCLRYTTWWIEIRPALFFAPALGQAHRGSSKPMIKLVMARTVAGLAFLFSQLVFALPAQAMNDVDYLSFATDDEANTTEVFSNASPSVVYVTSTALRRQMFSLNVMEIPQGAGSGFVWDDSGLIVTNYHVVARANRLTVTLSDQREFEAKVVG